MKKRNPFNQAPAFFSELKEKLSHITAKHPEKIVLGMFFILLVAVAIFLIVKATHKQNHRASASRLMSRMSNLSSLAEPSPGTSDFAGLMRLYRQTKVIDPDTITAKDSLLLLEINKDLHKILK